MAISILVMTSTDLIFKFDKEWKLIKIVHRFSKEVRGLLLSDYNAVKLTLISILIHLLSICIVILIAESMFLEVDYTSLLLVIPVAILLMTIPISIAGWGVREAVMVAGLGFVGMGSENALALSIMYGLLILIFSLPGILIWILNQRN
jgi:uncharacterized membrane protein YbhN (UPF0104 family)